MSGKLFLIVGPSGVGKGTLVRRLRARHPEFYFPPSATTREPRENEKIGEQYFFISDERFEKMKSAGEFLETATVHTAEKYGTLRAPIEDAVAAGKIVIREVDIQGLKSIAQNLEREKFSAIFISPPSFEILEKRIYKRQPGIAAEELERRLDSARKEIAKKSLADFEVVSGENEIEKMVADAEKIIAEN
jgi:guanylate kinase